jgi:tRNA threonylcarbamoyladenosine biosynthesis protein TsaB
VSSINPPSSAPLILALDTSSSLGSVALSRGGEVLKAKAFEADHGHSQKLLPAVDSVFTEAGVQAGDVTLFAAITGPGSFTGLRVALACVRGLAGDRPCFGSLGTDVAAWAARGRGQRVLAITDLFHGEVFGSVHDETGALISGREAGELGTVLKALGALLPGSVIAVGSAAVKHRNRIAEVVQGVEFLDLPEGLSPHLASLAHAQASEATTCRASDLMPFYLRDPLTRGLLNSQPKAR